MHLIQTPLACPNRKVLGRQLRCRGQRLSAGFARDQQRFTKIGPTDYRPGEHIRGARARSTNCGHLRQKERSMHRSSAAGVVTGTTTTTTTTTTRDRSDLPHHLILFDRGRQFFEAGDTIFAAIALRLAIETRLRDLARAHDCRPPKGKYGSPAWARALCEAGHLDWHCFGDVRRITKYANLAAHGRPVSAAQVSRMLTIVERLLADIGAAAAGEEVADA